MHRLAVFFVVAFVGGCLASPVIPDSIPPAPPAMEYDAPAPPFISREAARAAKLVARSANEWRPPGSVMIAVVADMNPSYGKTTYGPQVSRAAEWIANDLRPDLVICAGDMVAGQKRGLDYLAMWSAFDRAFYQPLRAAGYPLWVSPGNHDGAAGSYFAAERATYRQVWESRQPSRDLLAGSNWPFYYAFDHDGVLVVALDATTVGPLDQRQRDWLERTLREHQNARAKVLFGHVPPLPFAVGREWEVLADPGLESMLEEYGVDVFVTGHHHAYYPGRRGSVRYIGAAALGSGPRPLIGHTHRSERGVTVVTLLGDGEIHVEARIAPDFDRVISHADLPERIDHAGRHLHRDDVEVERAETR